MKISTTWQGKLLFHSGDEEHSASMDAKPPLGQGTALSPKQLALAAVTGCAGMDVASLLRKHKQSLTKLRIEAEAPLTKGEPAVFQEVLLEFYMEGDISPERAKEAVVLSQTKYCGVSAMMAKACPIRYHVYVNGQKIHEAQAQFD